MLHSARGLIDLVLHAKKTVGWLVTKCLVKFTITMLVWVAPILSPLTQKQTGIRIEQIMSIECAGWKL